ncbi:MAG: hypothetical protein KF753_16615 [Caldilineaceae bacterium]|nr:hypothetical protein [Caldilineaceae bacterium]
MTLDDLLFDIHVLEGNLHSYERKFSMLSSIFYEAYTQGEEPTNTDWVQDWTAWAGAYKVWLRRREQFRLAVDSLRSENQSLSLVIEKTARHESLPIPA